MTLETLPTVDALQAQAILNVQREHSILSDAMAAWVIMVRDFIEQVEGSNYTDRHGHSLEMNVHYINLKESVSE